MEDIHIRVLTHRDSGLVMGLTDDLPGFVVHANSKEELEAKLAPALKSFLRAQGQPVDDVIVERKDAPPGFDPPAFIARGQLDKRAA
jgi:hypothetical protein